MSNKKCRFCEAMQFQKFIYERNAPERIGNDIGQAYRYKESRTASAI